MGEKVNSIIDIFSNLTEEKSQHVLNATYYTYQRLGYAAQCHSEIHVHHVAPM